jgi:AcrR family transcriptional regulator
VSAAACEHSGGPDSKAAGADSVSTGARERLERAMLDLVSSQGYEATSVEELLEHAGATQAEFESEFSSKEDCALAVFDRFMEDCIGVVREAYEGESEWPGSLRAAAYALARWLDEHPREARFGGLEIIWVSELSQARRELALREFTRMADGGRAHAADPDSVSASTAEGVVGSVAEMLARRARKKGVSAYEFVPQLMYLAVLPYLGEKAAKKELTMPPPHAPQQRSIASEPGYRLSVAKNEPGGDSEAGLSRLPRGRHGLPRELVAENQRQRLITGVIEAVAEHGYGATTIAQITGAAKLSRRTFYEHFSNKEDCFSAAYEVSFSYIRDEMLAAAAGQEEWPRRVRAGLAGLLSMFAEHPELATFFLIAPTNAGDEMADRHHLAMRELVSGLIEGAPKAPSGSGKASEIREQALAGGISRLIVRKVTVGEAEELPELLPALVELVLRPFLGGEEAVRVAGEG